MDNKDAKQKRDKTVQHDGDQVHFPVVANGDLTGDSKNEKVNVEVELCPSGPFCYEARMRKCAERYCKVA